MNFFDECEFHQITLEKTAAVMAEIRILAGNRKLKNRIAAWKSREKAKLKVMILKAELARLSKKAFDLQVDNERMRKLLGRPHALNKKECCQ